LIGHLHRSGGPQNDCVPALFDALPASPDAPAAAAVAARPVHAAPCVLDIEASGFGRASYPIEIGYVLPDGRAVCMLVRPAPQWTHWDSDAEAVHGIPRQTLLRHGRPIREVAVRLNQDLGGRTVYCDGWAHDYAWLGALFEEAGRAPRFTLASAAQCLAEAHLPLLHGATRHARAELGLARHRASNDARALQAALVSLGAR
jgi:hypothetical protein